MQRRKTFSREFKLETVKPVAERCVSTVLTTIDSTRIPI